MCIHASSRLCPRGWLTEIWDRARSDLKHTKLIERPLRLLRMTGWLQGAQPVLRLESMEGAHVTCWADPQGQS
eukprot:4873697-Alexandrium_andersonii.AAC.1